MKQSGGPVINMQYYFNVYVVKVDQFWNYSGLQYNHQSVNYVHMYTHTHFNFPEIETDTCYTLTQEIHIICNPVSISVTLCVVSNNLSGASTSCLL